MSEFTSVTRCPFCRTSFHLGPMQLHAAGGKVRCGACLNIFDARAHFLVEQKYLFDMPAAIAAEPEQEPIPAEIEELQEDEPFDDLYPLITATPQAQPTSRLWGIPALIGLLLLPAQLFWWQPDALVQQPWYQEFLHANCNWLPCELNAFQDIQFLSLTGLIQPSSTHEQVLEALVELRNQGPLPQPFPSLSLRFMNLRGDLVSARVFAPTEYLQNEASGRRLIQPNQRVQIQLEIYDPGGDAISYEFEPLF